MPSLRHFSGVAHDIAHHAQSGLSYLHPYLSQLCRSLGITTISLDLLSAVPYGNEIKPPTPLTLSTAAVQAKFLEIVASKHLDVSDVVEAHLAFTFTPERSDDYNSAVRVHLTTSRGEAFEHYFPAF